MPAATAPPARARRRPPAAPPAAPSGRVPTSPAVARSRCCCARLAALGGLGLRRILAVGRIEQLHVQLGLELAQATPRPAVAPLQREPLGLDAPLVALSATSSLEEVLLASLSSADFCSFAQHVVRGELLLLQLEDALLPLVCRLRPARPPRRVASRRELLLFSPSAPP